MKFFKNAVLFAISIIFFYSIIPANIYAAQSIKVYIDGELMNFTQPAVIKNGSTMVPYRDIFEKLGAMVDYDYKTQMVTGTRGKEKVVLYIGSKTAYVNGIKKQLDYAPFVMNGRTMVPARFVSEALGSEVKWDGNSYTVNISTVPYKGYILGFYAVRSFPQFERRPESFSEISTYWFDINKDGTIKLSLPDGYESVRPIADKNGTKMSAMFYANKDILTSILADANMRTFLAKNIVEAAVQYNYDGINIDFEGLESGDKDNFIAFLNELKGYTIKNGLKMTVSLPPITKSTKWYQGYNFKEIGNIADDVVLMSYDYSGPTTDAGPIAPYYWVDEVINYAIDNGIPADKILLGIDFYGYDWAKGQPTNTLTLDEVIDKLGGKPYSWDENSLSPYYKYIDNGVEHTIWFEDGNSINLKLRLVKMYGLKGVAFWRIGTITESQLQDFNLWDVINKNIVRN